MVRHAAEIGWTPLPPNDALAMRDKESVVAAAKDSTLPPRVFGVYWTLKPAWMQRTLRKRSDHS